MVIPDLIKIVTLKIKLCNYKKIRDDDRVWFIVMLLKSIEVNKLPRVQIPIIPHHTTIIKYPFIKGTIS